MNSLLNKLPKAACIHVNCLFHHLDFDCWITSAVTMLLLLLTTSSAFLTPRATALSLTPRLVTHGAPKRSAVLPVLGRRSSVLTATASVGGDERPSSTSSTCPPPAGRGSPSPSAPATRASLRRALLRLLTTQRLATAAALRHETASLFSEPARRPLLLSAFAAAMVLFWPSPTRRIRGAALAFCLTRMGAAVRLRAPDPRELLGPAEVLSNATAAAVRATQKKYNE